MNYGFSVPCSICALDHPAMKKDIEINGQQTYQYCCPIAMRDHWPPKEEEEDWTHWNSLQPSAKKFAEYYYFNEEEIREMLAVWETSTYALLIPTWEVEDFKDEVLRLTENERQSWTFKRTLSCRDTTDTYHEGDEIYMLWDAADSC